MLPIIEKADDWTPTSARWVCLGPSLFKPPELEHIVTDPQVRSQHVVKDEFGWRERTYYRFAGPDGHADVRTTLKVYAHVIPQSQRESMERIANRSIGTKVANGTGSIA